MFNSIYVDLTWDESDLVTSLPIILSLVFFTTYWFVAKSEMIKGKFYAKYDNDEASFRHILFTKFFGFVSMGIIPLVFCLILLKNYRFQQYGFVYNPDTTVTSLACILGLSALVIPLVYFSAKKPKNLLNYPQIRSKVWTRKMMFYNALGWFFYLLGYEMLFRGVLLIPLVDSIGVWPAIAVNIALYSATHIPKGLDETVGAIPLGLVLCLLTLSTGTIWVALLVHVAMAWTNSFTAIKHHPEMIIQK